MTTQQVKIYDEISTVEYPAPNLWEVDRCFSSSTFGRLISISDTPGTEFRVAFLKKRLELDRSSVHFDLIDQIGQAMTSALSSIVGQSLMYSTSKYWLDLPTFGCQEHYDSSEIFLSYQIYLGSAFTTEISSEQHRDSNLDLIEFIDQRPEVGLRSSGAEFTHVDPPICIEFKTNHGYINLNSDMKLHKVRGSWDSRLSVMFQYTRV
jgi:hypothetical protein